MTNERIRPSFYYPYTSQGEVFASTSESFASGGEERKTWRCPSPAAVLPPLVKHSPMEVKVGYSWRSPSQGFASIGESFVNGGEERARGDA
ncbi:hypothetical protein R1flu_015871 [Riccia fluitans]|uniref:Uncharacterized protein n=1 Tax=Riccia fluitans TaxID=41844 RepID=A0ABD1YKK3_9MARC